jgi:hypothetical protein
MTKDKDNFEENAGKAIKLEIIIFIVINDGLFKMINDFKK